MDLPKKPYVTPRLIVYGRVTQLTAGGSGPTTEMGMMASMQMMRNPLP